MHWTAYGLSNIAVVPTDDMLFVERYVWAWGMEFERSVAALSIGLVDEGIALCQSLLARGIPDDVRERVLANMAAARAA